MTKPRAPTLVDRYELHELLASGGMAEVFLGRQHGSVGFSRVVAIKRIHEHLAQNVEFVEMFLDEARVASRVRHPNVIPIVDIVDHQGELMLVMDYVAGASFAPLLDKVRDAGERVPLDVLLQIVADALRGLHAAHLALDEQGAPLGIVHRDLSPHNILVGADGMARVFDFGVAKAEGRVHRTRRGELKGKAGYMAPEYMVGASVDLRADIYSLGLTLWEGLVGKLAFVGDTDAERMTRALKETLPPPGQLVPEVPATLSAVVMRALEREPAQRFATALDMLEAVGQCGVPSAPPRRVAAWLSELAGELLAERAATVSRIAQSKPLRA